MVAATEYERETRYVVGVHGYYLAEYKLPVNGVCQGSGGGFEIFGPLSIS